MLRLLRPGAAWRCAAAAWRLAAAAAPRLPAAATRASALPPAGAGPAPPAADAAGVQVRVIVAPRSACSEEKGTKRRLNMAALFCAATR